MNALIVFFSMVAASSAQIAHLPYNNYYGQVAAGPYAVPAAVAGPYGVPAALPAALTAPSSQFQAQDELGNVNYGYQNINSAKQEVGNAYGGVTGSYSYVDAYGIPQRVDYIADALGFRVKATNLPVAPKSIAIAPVFDLEAPLPVQDTEEVAAAKAIFKIAFDEAASREKRDAVLPYAGINALPYGYNNFAYNNLAFNNFNNLGYNNLGYNNFGYNNLGYAGLGYAAPAAVAAAPAVAYAAPVAAVASPYNTISAPATREAVLTTIKLNPGHAVAYRVD